MRARSTQVTQRVGLTGQVRVQLAERLRERRVELEQAVLTRVYAISDPSEAADPTYAEGLRAAVSAALEYGLAGIEAGGERPPPIPDVLLMQARFAARNGVSLDTVLRRYLAGYTLLGDVLIEETQDGELIRDPELKPLLRAQAALLDRLLATVGEEHAREAESRPESSEQRRTERIQRLLNGELVDTSGFAYDFDAHHLGAVAAGPDAARPLYALAAALDRRLLLIQPAEGVVWAWLGGRRRIDLDEVGRLCATWPEKGALAVGEPGEGLSGWRHTHRQAAAALAVAQRGSMHFVRYADVAIVVAALRDDLLSASLREMYLAPLSKERDGGETLRETLRAYFAADRNVSSAAAALGVSRQAIAKRLRAVEEKLGRDLGACGIELEIALRLEDFDRGQIATQDTGLVPH